jgi:diguanylate cyclase (GGDEF)-like protein
MSATLPGRLGLLPRRTIRQQTASIAAAARRVAPQGRILPDEVWRRRHRIIVALCWLHVPAIAIFGVMTGSSLDHSLAEASIVALTSALASWSLLGRSARSAMASLALLLSSAILVHLSGGLVELHFHFFVTVALLALYQDWLPFLLAIGFVVVHHFVFGLLAPGSVFDHVEGQRDPLLWSLLHGTYIGVLSLISLVGWSMSQLAYSDALTGLPSRTLFLHRVEEALRAAGSGHRRPAVLFVDLDDFKTINDSLGHASGDALLVSVGQRIRGAIRSDDTAARLGGDEFAVLAMAESTAEATSLAERIRQVLAEPYELDGSQVTVRASIGVVLGDRDADDAAGLLRDADLAMYSAKGCGKDRFEIFQSAMHDAARRRLQLKEGLRHAVERGELTLQFQPIVDLRTAEMTAVEALARWNHPQLGQIPPAEFIPLAEETGFIIPMGREILALACRSAVRFQTRSPGLVMSVNLSVLQLQSPDIVADVHFALATSGLSASDLILEITESMVMDDAEAALDALTALKSVGCRIAVDDFGTGYSSLSYLRRLPVDILKIDRSFVVELQGIGDRSTLAGAVISVSQMFGLATVAEGVEEAGQLDALRALGCDQAQGYLFARPMDAADLEVLLADATELKTA